MIHKFKKISILLLAALIFVACDDDDSSTNPDPVVSNTFKVSIENVGQEFKFLSSGMFNTPVGASGPGPIFPGDSYEFTFSAGKGHKVSFVTMMVQSNDLFYAPGEAGIELFDASGNPVTGDITSQISLWDAGTEADQEPGLGTDQAPRQAGGDTGAADPNNTVRLATDTFGNLPNVSDVIRVTLSNTNQTNFTLRIENVSTATTLSTSDGNTHAVPMAPGAWAVHSENSPIFTAGQPDRGNGLEEVAEDGETAKLSAYAAENSGLVTPFAPGVFAVHTSGGVFFMNGTADRGEGLEALAEDGDPSVLASSVVAKSGVNSSGVFNTPVTSNSPAPIFPGGRYEFTFDANPGDYLSFATMMVQSNDLFVGTAENGIILYEGNNPLLGDITSMLSLWDAGTEVNEEPGVGANQAPRQSGPNTGTTESGTVKIVSDGFVYPSVSSLVKVTIELQ